MRTFSLHVRLMMNGRFTGNATWGILLEVELSFRHTKVLNVMETYHEMVCGYVLYTAIQIVLFECPLYFGSFGIAVMSISLSLPLKILRIQKKINKLEQFTEFEAPVLLQIKP